jgi:DNA-binding NarL/FixJ family response regulator
MRVYLVEDAPVICDRLAEMLGAIHGVEVTGQTGSVPQAISGILDGRPDAVVLDMKLADGNGLQVLRAVCKQAPEVQFIVLTNYADDFYRDMCLRAGARFFFDKSSEFALIPGVLRQLGSQQPGSGTNQQLG